jgi:hypothetical protein
MLVESMKKGDRLENLGVDEWIILKRILKKLGGRRCGA